MLWYSVLERLPEPPSRSPAGRCLLCWRQQRLRRCIDPGYSPCRGLFFVLYCPCHCMGGDSYRTLKVWFLSRNGIVPIHGEPDLKGFFMASATIKGMGTWKSQQRDRPCSNCTKQHLPSTQYFCGHHLAYAPTSNIFTIHLSQPSKVAAVWQQTWLPVARWITRITL